MARYILKRLLLMIPVILGVAVLIFTIMYFVPGDPAEILLGSTATKEEIAELREQMGLNDPYFVQLARYLKETFLQFDFGISYFYGTGVKEEILRRFPKTLFFALGCMIIKTLIGTPLGITAAVHQNSLQDQLVMTIAMVFNALPGFWVALELVIIFALRLQWLPSTGVDTWQGWILPMIAGSMAGVAMQARQTRSGMLEVIRSDYVTTARAKGLTEHDIIYKHALPNALIPLIQIVGEGFGRSLGGSLIIETVFTIPGMGIYMTRAITNRDYPVVRGCVLFLAISFSIIMLLIDLGFAFADPRIKAQYERNNAKKAQKKEATSNA